jgi:hypothetical protein
MKVTLLSKAYEQTILQRQGFSALQGVPIRKSLVASVPFGGVYLTCKIDHIPINLRKICTFQSGCFAMLPLHLLYFQILKKIIFISCLSVVEVCTGQKFRILPGPARRPFVPTQPEPEVYLQICYPYPTQARLSFIPARMKPDLFTICPDYRIINAYSF